MERLWKRLRAAVEARAWFYTRVLWRPILYVSIVAVPAAIGAWDLARAQLFPRSWEEHTPRVWELLIDLPLMIWTISVPIVVSLLVLEGAFRATGGHIHTKRLKLLYDHSKQPFFDHKNMWIVTDDGGFAREQKVWRFGVYNDSPDTVPRVAVELEDMKPSVLSPPLPLHKTHDNPPDEQYVTDFPVDSEQTVYVDVLLHTVDAGKGQWPTVYHAVPGIPRHLPPGNYTLEIDAHGQGVKGDRKVVNVEVKGDGSVGKFEVVD